VETSCFCVIGYIRQQGPFNLYTAVELPATSNFRWDDDFESAMSVVYDANLTDDCTLRAHMVHYFQS